tara:strand:+ start:750 stop:1403 length:654 start_codon:yes stop_codon:yes gene_type:complete
MSSENVFGDLYEDKPKQQPASTEDVFGDLSEDPGSTFETRYDPKMDGFYKIDVPSDLKISQPTAYNVITSHVGMRGGKMHEGIDIRAREGTPIMAFQPGIVTKVVRTFTENKGPGKYVVIENPETGEQHKYFHLSSIGDDLKVGSQIKAGQTFGTAGNTGGSHGAHLHFEIHQQDDSGEYQPVDPLEAYPEHFGSYIDKKTGEPVNINKVLETNLSM